MNKYTDIQARWCNAKNDCMTVEQCDDYLQ